MPDFTEAFLSQVTSRYIKITASLYSTSVGYEAKARSSQTATGERIHGGMFISTTASLE